MLRCFESFANTLQSVFQESCSTSAGQSLLQFFWINSIVSVEMKENWLRDESSRFVHYLALEPVPGSE